VFVTKLNAEGSALRYATFSGGRRADKGYAIAVDAAGEAYMTGLTISVNFPTTPGAFDTTDEGRSYHAFVTKIDLVAEVAQEP
jgi:hypothetical protein